jgi:hypothetical protein
LLGNYLSSLHKIVKIKKKRRETRTTTAREKKSERKCNANLESRALSKSKYMDIYL